MSHPFTFDRLVPGMLVGERADRIDRQSLDLWQDIYGQRATDPLPADFASVLVMRAYLTIVSPRPPGNIHRLLTVRMHEPLRAEVPLAVAVTCAGKRARDSRLDVQFHVAVRTAGRLAVEGEIDMRWAA